MSNTVIDDASVVSCDVEPGIKKIIRSCGVKPSSVEPSVPARSGSNKRIEVPNSTPTFDICTVQGGKFNLKLSKSSSKTISSDTEVGICVQRKSASKQFRGEKCFNRIPIINTPTKRKLESDTNVSKIARYFDSMPATSQGQHISSESPAKRRKWGQVGVKLMNSDI